MKRQDTRTAVANVLKATPNVKFVGTFRPKLQTSFPSIVVSLPRSKEERISGQAPYGKKRIEYTAQLEIFTVDNSPDGSGQLDFDDLLDGIDAQLRLDPTLGGTVLAAAIHDITTTVAAPQLVEGQAVGLLAVKTFDVTVQVTG